MQASGGSQQHSAEEARTLKQSAQLAPVMRSEFQIKSQNWQLLYFPDVAGAEEFV